MNKNQKDNMTKASLPKVQEPSDKITDKPQISEMSQELAKKRRQNMGANGLDIVSVLQKQAY